jgi:hypothetical protein
MIHYQLQCSQGHGFDGWFKDSAAFDAQAGHGLLECPFCSDTQVTRALMSPAVPKRERAALPPPVPVAAKAKEPAGAEAAEAAPVTSVAGQRMPDQIRAVLQRLRTEVERNCDYVGEAFADEARRMHRGESERRGIYGEASPEQAESLAEEGIEVARIPWLPRADG